MQAKLTDKQEKTLHEYLDSKPNLNDSRHLERHPPGDEHPRISTDLKEPMKNELSLKTRREFLRTTVLGSALSWTVPAFLANTFSALQAEAADSRHANRHRATTRPFWSSCKWPAAMTG